MHSHSNKNSKTTNFLLSACARFGRLKYLIACLVLSGWSATALAHSPTIVAKAVCETDAGLVINYTSTS